LFVILRHETTRQKISITGKVTTMEATSQVFACLLLAGAMGAAMTTDFESRGQKGTSPIEQNDVAAIDILLDPDATMIQHAQAANARLLQNFSKGYSLGGEHAPHISMLQRYVKTASLDQVYAAAGKVFAKENPTSWKLKAVKYGYIPDKGIGLAIMVVEPTADLLRLQRELIDAVAPLTVPTGSAAAFVTTPQDPDIIPAAIQYVAVFIPEHSGDHYVPHVSVGVGTIDFLNSMVAAPFETFTFSPVGASVYHLGNYGTAMTKLHSFELKADRAVKSASSGSGR
jgi:hypothetical protein